VRVILVAAVAATLAACGSSTKPHSPGSPLDGRWFADLPGQTLLSFDLRVSDSTVTGTGAIGTLTNLGTMALAVTGRFVDPNVSLFITGGLGAMTFVGALDRGNLDGTLDGAGYVGLRVRFTKR